MLEFLPKVFEGVVFDYQGTLQDSLTMVGLSIAETETGAILLALRLGERAGRSLNILTDSMRAIKNITAGRIPRSLRHILPDKFTKTHNVSWCPGHEGLEGNEKADRVARELTHRALPDHSYTAPPLETLGEYLAHCRLRRRAFPLPHRALNNHDANALRRIQTNTFVHKSRLALMFPNNMNEHCNRCGQRSTLQHATWECTAIWPSEDSTNTTHHTKTWEAALASPALEDQTILVRRAWRGAAESGALD